jgi:hypothetical protein
MKILAFRPLERNSLRGFATVQLDSGMVVADCSYHVQGNSSWVSPPGKPMLDPDKRQVLKDGKPQYSAVIDFIDAATRRRWSDAVVTAVEAYLAEARQ